MTPDAIERCAQLLKDARLGNYFIEKIPADCEPKTLADGYAVQERLLQLLGTKTTGYLLGLTNEYMQKIFHVDAPYYARILAPNLHRSPKRFGPKDLLTRGLECEVAFRIARDLPPRGKPYSTDAVADAVATMHPSIEVVNGHFENWLDLPMPIVLADNGTDGPLVCGEGTADWRRIDRINLPVILRVNDRIAAEGKGANALGDPLKALTWLANALNAKGLGLKAGETVNTGTCAKLIPAKPGDKAVATFGPLGEVRIVFDA